MRLWHLRRATCAWAAVLWSAALASCGGGGGGSSPPPITYTAGAGLAQKGPLILGSTVTVQELSAALAPTGKQYSYQITSNLGAFSPSAKFGTQYVGVIASGYYFDEVANATSSGTVTLNAYGDLSADAVLNVNLLTTLAYQRIQNLVSKSNMSFAAARTQAEREVLTALNIASGSYGKFGSLDLSGTSDGDHILAAVSSMFVTGNSAGALSQLIATFQNELGSNGVITNPATRAALLSAAQAVDPAAVAANLSAYYAPQGISFTPSNISDWIATSADGVIGKFVFQVPLATPTTSFTFPAAFVSRFAGTSVSASAGQLSINGTPATGAATFKAGDTVTLSPGVGNFPNGVLTSYLASGAVNLAKVSFESGLVSIAVTPNTPSVRMGLTQQFMATGTYSDTSTADLTGSVAWATKTPYVASIDPSSGLASALLIGSTDVTATIGAVSGGTTLNVTRPPSGTWAPTGSLAAVAGHTATLLQDGRVLVAGGSNGPFTQIYDPATGTWTHAGDMVGVHYAGETATLLPNGKVLVLGGYSGGANTSEQAELFDPATSQWSLTGNFPTTIANHTATLLANGKVLVAGGTLDFQTGPKTAAAELYDPATGLWTPTGSLGAARDYHTATLLPNGRVLVAGGYISTGNGSSVNAELYDPANGTWSATGNLAVARVSLSAAVLLPNGKVLLTGGLDPSSSAALSSADLYDPVGGIWSATGSLHSLSGGFPMTLLPNGLVLAAGSVVDASTGRSKATAELYDPATATWSATGGPDALPGGGYTLTVLQNGTVLAAGATGFAPPPSVTAELYFY